MTYGEVIWIRRKCADVDLQKQHNRSESVIANYLSRGKECRHRFVSLTQVMEILVTDLLQGVEYQNLPSQTHQGSCEN